MSNALHDLSNALAATVGQVEAGIVRVEARRRAAASGIVWTAEGVILTAHHVVERPDKIQVGLPDGQTVTATLAGRDPTTDLAVLRLPVTDLTPAERAPEGGNPLQVGQLVLAVARPGAWVQASLGVISALGARWRTPPGGEIDQYVQTDVVMYPGFSGGALVNAAGQLVGLNSSALRRGASVTIPLTTLELVVETLLAHGRMRRGYLGVNTQPVRLPEAVKQQLNQETGLMLAGIEPDSPAEKSGLLLGDVLVSLAGAPIRHHDDLLITLTGERIGQAVSFRLLRGGELKEVAVTIGEKGQG
jgi:S1-C subfamily serine protease